MEPDRSTLGNPLSRRTMLLPAAPLLVLGSAARAHVPLVVEVAAGEDWCAVANEALEAGDHVALGPGEHRGGCVLTRAGKEYTEPTVVKALDDDDPPVIRTTDPEAEAALVLDADYLSVVGLHIAPTPAGVPGLRVRGAGGRLYLLTVEEPGGDGLLVEEGAGGLTVYGVEILEPSGHGLLLGCAEGCELGTVEAEALLVRGAGGSSVLAHPGVTLELLDSVLGPGGAATLDLAAPAAAGAHLVDRSVLVAEADPAVRLGGTLALQSSVVVGEDVGVALLDGAALGLRGVTLHTGGAPLQGLAADGLLHAENTATSGAEAPDHALLDAAAGNVHCEVPEACWRDPEAWDFVPRDDSPLLTAGASPATGSPPPDLCARERPVPPQVGAIERLDESEVSMALSLEQKACTFTGEPPAGLDTGEHGDSGRLDSGGGTADAGSGDGSGGSSDGGGGAGGDPATDGSCGCRAAGASLFTLGLVALARRRR